MLKGAPEVAEKAPEEVGPPRGFDMFQHGEQATRRYQRMEATEPTERMARTERMGRMGRMATRSPVVLFGKSLVVPWQRSSAIVKHGQCLFQIWDLGFAF
eukprot:Skav221936  [mRNA]  locus=scaffold195:342303:342602:+ [translate_table: standard]